VILQSVRYKTRHSGSTLEVTDTYGFASIQT